MPAKKKKKLSRKRYSLRTLTCLALLWLPVSIAYYFLPQEARRPVYEVAPRFDRMLQHTAFQLLSTWDELGIGGQDCTVPEPAGQKGLQAYGGWPSGGSDRAGQTLLLGNSAYTVGYCESLRNPLWAVYRVADVPVLDAPAPRPAFRRDPRSSAGVKPEDFTGSGYDRGHLAPNFAIATHYGEESQKETFLMTNIMPQNPLVNRYLWKNLEHRIAQQYGRYFGEVWVTTGPVFSHPVEQLPSGIAIPSAYYMIVADIENGQLRVMAFLVEKNTRPWTRIRTCLVSIDHLEELTGLDFFPNLTESAQEKLESQPATRLWPWLLPGLCYHFR